MTVIRVPTELPDVTLAAEHGEAFDPFVGEVVSAWLEYTLEHGKAFYRCGGHWILPHDQAFALDLFADDRLEGKRTIYFAYRIGVIKQYYAAQSYSHDALDIQYWAWRQLGDALRQFEVWWAVFEAGGPIVAVARTAREALALARHVTGRFDDTTIPNDVPIYRLRREAEPRLGRYYLVRATSRLAHDFLQHRPGGCRYRYRLVDGKLDLVEQEERT